MAPRLFHRILVANRGEVAARIAKTCDALGITPVFAVSAADRDAPYTRDRETVELGPAASAKSYLDMHAVVQAAVQARCSALHPGWGFLSENPQFSALCKQHGVTFIGPPAHVMRLMGKKTPAKRAMKAAGLATIPGSDGVLQSAKEAAEVASSIGYPVLLKAESGGGGRGMRIARKPEDIEAAYADAQAESQAAFGDSRLYMEKLIEGGRHVEVQVLVDGYGSGVHVGERDCTVQRNHQKLIEESPAPTLTDDARNTTLELAVKAAVSIGYTSAGTMEFLVGDDGIPRFMEMNTRLQVEHSVSEMRSGLDLVAEQIRIAAGHRLSITQDDVELKGHAIECRINAEDPEENFRPSPGKITNWSPPTGAGEIRVDTHVETGYVVPPHYDSLLCKVISFGADRAAAIKTMDQALAGFNVEGVKTNINMFRTILGNDDFQHNRYDTRAIPGWPKGD